MSAVATAIVGGAVVGAVASKKAADKAASSQAEATAAAKEASDEQLAFQKQQYDDWKSIYGDVQEHLSEYYNNMTPESITALGIDSIQQSHNQAVKNLERELAQRGLSTSGAAAQGFTMLEQEKAREIANVKVQAPQVVADRQQSFLGTGLGLESSLQQGISGTLGSQATMESKAALQYGEQASQATAAMGKAISSGISNYLTYKKIT